MAEVDGLSCCWAHSFSLNGSFCYLSPVWMLRRERGQQDHVRSRGGMG